MARISTKVELYITRIWDAHLLKKLPDYGGLIRVFSLIKLKTRSGWSETYRALIDTGAHTSVIPKYIWKSSEHRIISAYEVRGLVPNDECRMDVKIGKLRVILFDENKNQTEVEEITAFLAERDDLPLIIGFKDLLENYELNIILKDEKGFLSKV